MPRGKRLSNDLRAIIINLGFHFGADDIAKYSGCRLRTIERILADYRRLGIAEHPSDALGCRRAAQNALSVDNRRYLIGLMRRQPDAYLDELRERLREATGHNIHDATVWRTLHRNGFKLKKLTRQALERNEDLRAEFKVRVGKYKPEQLVAVDESSFDRRTALRNRSWALKGRRALRKCFFVRGRRYSLLPALSLSGICYVSVVEGSFTTERFREFIIGLLDRMKPYPQPNSVILMDNARIHHDPDILDIITARGMRYCFLPPYSPDFNPIELAFSAIKAFVKREGMLRTLDQSPDEEDDSEIRLYIKLAALTVTSEDAQGFFYKCGYL